MAAAKTTTDHKAIRRWIDLRKGVPCVVRDKTIIRICFNKARLQTELTQIPWPVFFEHFEKAGLSFLYQDEKDSRFFKFVKRERAEQKVAA